MKLLSAFTDLPRLGPILAPASLPLALVSYLALGLNPLSAWWVFVGANLCWMIQDILKDVTSKTTA